MIAASSNLSALSIAAPVPSFPRFSPWSQRLLCRSVFVASAGFERVRCDNCSEVLLLMRPFTSSAKERFWGFLGVRTPQWVGRTYRQTRNGLDSSCCRHSELGQRSRDVKEHNGARSSENCEANIDKDTHTHTCAHQSHHGGLRHQQQQRRRR